MTESAGTATTAPPITALLTTVHTDTAWQVICGHESQWTVSVAKTGVEPPRLRVRHRDEHHRLGPAIDCGVIGQPERFGTWDTEEAFLAFCATFLGAR